MSDKAQGEPRRHPRSPWIGLLFMLGWGIAFAAALVLFVDRYEEALRFDMVGRRTEGFILVTPWLYLPLAVFTGVRALLAIGPWVSYRSRTTLDQRRRDRAFDLGPQRPSIGAVIFGSLFLLGGLLFVVTGVISLVRGITGPALLLSLGMGCLIGGAAAVGQHVHHVYFRRFRDTAEQGAPPADVRDDEWQHLRRYVRSQMARPPRPAPRRAMTPVGGVIGTVILLLTSPLALVVPGEAPFEVRLVITGAVALLALSGLLVSVSRIGRWSEARRIGQHWIASNGGALPPELRIL